jgi:hypothetical protein
MREKRPTFNATFAASLLAVLETDWRGAAFLERRHIMNGKVLAGFVAGCLFAVLLAGAHHGAQGQAPAKEKFEFRSEQFNGYVDALAKIRKLAEEDWEYIGLVEVQSYKALQNLDTGHINSVPAGLNTGAFKRRLK